MLSKARLEQISEMEGILNEADAFLAEAEAFFEKWQNFLPKMEALERYYFNGDWREDYEAYEQGEIPPICLVAFWAKILFLMRVLCNGSWRCNG